MGIGHWALGIGHWALGIGHWALEEYLTLLRTAIVFFSDRTVSQILGELMDIRGDCQSWLAAGEADYHDRKGKTQAINKAPQLQQSCREKSPFLYQKLQGAQALKQSAV